MERAPVPDFNDSEKNRVFVNTAMLYVTDSLREIENQGYNHPESETRLRHAEQLLWQMFKRPSIPKRERLEWLTHGIYYLRGAFGPAERVGGFAEKYIQEQPLTVALYRDLLTSWSALYREVEGKKSQPDHFSSFEKLLLQRYENKQGSKEATQRDEDRHLIEIPKLVVVKL